MSVRARQFEEIYQATKGAVYAYLRGFISHEQDCEEAYQETWLTLARRLAEVEPEHPRAYVLRLAHTQVVKRRRASSKPSLSDPNSVLAPPATDGPAADAREAVRQLPPHLREVFCLRHQGGLAYDEIAEVLAIPPGTVASRLHSAVTELRRRLSPHSTQLLATEEADHKS